METVVRAHERNKITKSSSRLLSYRKERLGKTNEKMVFTVVLNRHRPVAYSMMMIKMMMMIVTNIEHAVEFDGLQRWL
jgi:hypothetical protein